MLSTEASIVDVMNIKGWSANILQIADVVHRGVSLLCFQTIVSRETSKIFCRVLCNFSFHNQNNSTLSLGLFGEQCINLQMCCTFGLFIAKFFQICSTIAAYAELCVCFQPAYRYILGNQKNFLYLLSSHLLSGRFKSKLYESGTSTIA